MFEELKTRSRRFLARKRQHSSVQALHHFAMFIERCYDNDEWDMCANGETALMRRLAPAHFSVVFDVGAHVGDWSIEALKTWPQAHAHAFEVAAPTYGRLTTHVEAAGFSSRATLRCLGLSDARGSRDMYYFAEHPQLTCDMPRHPYASTLFTAQLIDGDSYVEQQGITSIDFMKIDVEGAEHLVLKGLRKTLESGGVHCVQFEIGAFSIQTKVLLADYYNMLGSLFWIGKVFPTHVEFREYEWTMESFRFSNFLCVSRKRPDLKELAETPAAEAHSWRLHRMVKRFDQLSRRGA
jgi:FkbM family methyltransferase